MPSSYQALVWLDFEWHGIVWFGLVGYGLAWFGIPLKLNYQVSLLALDGVGGWGWGKSKLRLNSASAELGNRIIKFNGIHFFLSKPNPELPFRIQYPRFKHSWPFPSLLSTFVIILLL